MSHHLPWLRGLGRPARLAQINPVRRGKNKREKTEVAESEKHGWPKSGT